MIARFNFGVYLGKLTLAMAGERQGHDGRCPDMLSNCAVTLDRHGGWAKGDTPALRRLALATRRATPLSWVRGVAQLETDPIVEAAEEPSRHLANAAGLKQRQVQVRWRGCRLGEGQRQQGGRLRETSPRQ